MRPKSKSLPSGAVLTLDLFDGEPKDSSLAWTDGENSEAVVIKTESNVVKRMFESRAVATLRFGLRTSFIGATTHLFTLKLSVI